MNNDMNNQFGNNQMNMNNGMMNNNMNNQMNMNNGMMNNNMNNQMNNGYINSQPKSGFNFVSYIIGFVLKPFDKFKSEEENLGNIKNSAILAAIVSVCAVVLTIIKVIFAAVRVSYYSGETKWVWDNLKYIKFFKVIGQYLLIYIGILAIISGVYFLASLIIKKETKFPKLLGLVSSAIIPYVICTAVIDPIFSLISSQLGSCMTMAGRIYSFVILIVLSSELITIENKNTKIYYHAACLAISTLCVELVLYKLVLGL